MSTATAELKPETEVEMKFAWIPPGRFMMGSDQEEDENPIHRVTITEGFWMGIYPVTQAQFEAVMGYNPSYFRGPDRPVESVNWDDAQEFCVAFGKLTNQDVKLPTEAEWEYACRAATTSEYWSGNDVSALTRVGWYGSGDEPSKATTQPVGKLEKNPWGLYDVHGNVWEFCADWYGPYEAGDQTDPLEESDDSDESGPVIRGGGWYDDPNLCRAAFRNWVTSEDRDHDVGFRVIFRPASASAPGTNYRY